MGIKKGGKVNYDAKYHCENFGRILKDEVKYISRGYWALKNYFVSLNPSSKVLEFGTGVGQNLHFIQNPHGIDINKELYPALKKRGIIMYDLPSDIPDNYFDEILISMVLEHLPNPIETIKMLRNKLKNDGRIRVILPNVSQKIGPRGGLNHSITGHLFGWTFYEINYLMNYCGFKNIKNIKIYRRGLERFAPVFNISKGLYLFLVKSLGLGNREFEIMIISVKK